MEKTLEQKLLEWCVRYVHDLCRDDNGMIEWVMNELGCTEWELFSGFHNLGEDHGFELEPEE